MNNTTHQAPLKLAILQRVCPPYRIPLFHQLSEADEIKMLLFIGDDIPNSKVKNSQELPGINYKKLRTKFLRLGSRTLPWHRGLLHELRKFSPDVILCEGESHFLGYLQAIFYKIFFNNSVALIHWCFISLPGWPAIGGTGFRFWIKSFFRNFFDAFVVYSSFSKHCLMNLGQPSNKIFVATNVGNVEHFIEISKKLTDSKYTARKKLNLPQKFTVLYVGTLDENKRPNLMVDLAKECEKERFNFVLLGSGDLLDNLRKRIAEEKLSNVFLPGRVTKELPLYYRAADVLLVPGRGGIVISEAMAFGLPVMVHQADGTEYDLIQNGVSGVHIAKGNKESFRVALEQLADNPELCSQMGRNSKKLLHDRFTTKNMAKEIICACKFATNTNTTK